VRGEKLIAPLRAYLMSPDFPSFTVKVEGLGNRVPDFHFHPSEHPAWNPRSLYLWMTQPELLTGEPDNPTAVLSMTAGSIWHSIIGFVLHDALKIVDALEVPVSDPVRRTRGKMDGVIGDEVYELKSMKESRLRMITDVAEYIRLNPTYHLQANEYMRMSGMHTERVLLMSLTFPYEMREFVIDYDHVLGQQTVEKYEAVLQAVADGRMPMCEGCFKGNTCPSRGVCRTEMG
jgi:hypothetical protein